MMNKVNWYKVGTIVFAIGFVIMLFVALFKSCGGCPEPKIGKQIDTSKVVTNVPEKKPDTVRSERPKPRPQIHVDTIYADNGSVFWEQMYMDLSRMYDELDGNYRTVNYYDMILKDDTSAFIRYEPSVSMNELQARGKLTFINRRATSIQTFSPYKTRFGIGGGLNYSWDKSMVSIKASALLVTKKNLAITIEADPFLGYGGASIIYVFNKQ